MGVYFYPCLVLAGGTGALLRYLLGRWAVESNLLAWPYGTLAANLLGCFMIGYLSSAFSHRFTVSSDLQIIVLTGFLGGFTTFSAFSLETISMFEQGDSLRALLYIGIQVFFCLILCSAGILLARQ